MFQHKETTSTAGRYRLRVDIPPSYELDDIDMVNDYNVTWNIRTLTLMARARMIELDADPPPALYIDESMDPDLQREIFDAAVATYRTTRVVRVLQQDHEQERTWQTFAEPERQRSRRFAERSLSLMRTVLDAKQCVADVLATVYGIGGTEPDARWRVWVAPACGGCPHCRETGARPSASPLPSPPPSWAPVDDLAPALRSQMGPDRVLAIFYQPPTKRREERALGEVIAWFAGQGVRNFLVPPRYFELAREALEPLRLVVFLSERFDPIGGLELPRAPVLILHSPAEPLPSDLYLRRPVPGTERPPRVLVLPVDSADPERDGVALRDRFRYPSLLMEEFRARYSI